jgi:hypothetical protein
MFCGGQCGGVGELLISLGLPFLALYFSRIKRSLVKVKKKLFPGIADTEKTRDKGTKYRYCGEWRSTDDPKAGPRGFTSHLHKPVPITLAITKFNNSNRIRAQESLKGVKGWLLLFCINLTIFIPASCLYKANCTFDLFNSTKSKILLIMFKGLFLYNVLIIVFMVFLAVFGFYVGLRLWKVNPKAVKTAKVFLITQLSVTLIIIFTGLWIDFPLGSHELIFGDLLRPIIPALLNFSLWYLYLSFSKRVHNTFSEAGRQRAGIGQYTASLEAET